MKKFFTGVWAVLMMLGLLLAADAFGGMQESGKAALSAPVVMLLTQYVMGISAGAVALTAIVSALDNRHAMTGAKGVLTGVWAMLGVLLLVLLVPSSPALMVDTPTLLWASGVDSWGSPSGLIVTAYGVMLGVAALLAITSTVTVCAQKMQDPLYGGVLALVSGGCALVVSHLLFCALRWGYIINDLAETPAYLIQFWKGGYTMYGAILGGLMGAALYALLKKRSIGQTMDAIIPGLTMLVTLGRAAEHFTSQGMGTYVVNEALSMLPFVRTNEWGEMQLPVYIYETLIGAIALIVVVAMLLRGRARHGRAAETGLAIISAGQVLMDSWRGDELIRFGFVRLNMICAAVTLLVIIILRIVRAVRRDGRWRTWTWLRLLLLFAAAGLVIAIEFALDKSTINNTLLYGVMTAAVALLGTAVLVDGR